MLRLSRGGPWQEECFLGQAFHGRWEASGPASPTPLLNSPELLYIKFTRKDQTLRSAWLVKVKCEFIGFLTLLQGFYLETKTSSDFLVKRFKVPSEAAANEAS